MKGGPQAIATIIITIIKQFVVKSSAPFNMFFIKNMLAMYTKTDTAVLIICK